MKVFWLLSIVGLVSMCVAPSSVAALDTAPWARVLSRHVREGRMDYAALQADSDARRDLTLFLRSVAKMQEDEPLANWLNAYNALVVASALGHFPTNSSSVRNIPGFFDAHRHRIAGQMRTFDEIVQQILRERFKDSRMHIVISYAAVSSPPLPAEPLVPGTLDATLTRLCEQYVANEHNVHMEGDRLAVSSVFFWFPDFARDAGSVIGWIKKYGGPRYASLSEDTMLIEINYNWALNTPRPMQAKTAGK